MKYLSKLTSTTCNLEGVDGILTGNQNLYGAATGETWDYYVRVTDEGGFVDSLYAAANGIGDYGNSFLTGIVYAEGGFLTGGTVKAQNVLTQGIGAKGSFGLSVDNTNVITALSSGNVGVGATAPLRKLHVAGGDGFAVNASTSQYYGVFIPALGEGANPEIQIGDWHNAGARLQWNSSTRALSIDTQYSTGAGTFNITGNDFSSTFLTVASSGNVGIGTSSPSSMLTLNGTTPYIRLERGGTPTWEIRQNYPSTEYGFQIVNVTNSNIPFFIGESSNVGIGTTSPASYYSTKLVVSVGDEDGITIAGSGDNYLMFADGTTGADRYRGFIQYSHTADYMAFATDASERMRITSSGNVGIGTVSPVSNWLSGFDPSTGNSTFKLTSEGWIVTPYLTGLASYYPAQGARPIIWSDNNGTNIQSWDNSATDGISLKSSNGTTRFFVREDGNVGIGTTNPGSTLEVDGSFNVKNGDGNITHFNYVDGSTNYVRGTTYFDTAPVYFTGGNVGIGTTAPSSTLHVSKASAVFQITDTNKTANNSLWIQALSQTSWGIGTANNSASGTKITIADSGNVGIGTTSPQRILELSQGEPYLRFNPTTVSAPYLLGAADGKFYFTPEATYVATMTLSSGNVGIGTTSPSYKLDVAGNSRFVSGNESLTMFQVNGWATNYLNSSLSAGAVAHIFGKANSLNNSATLRYYHAADASTSNYIGLGFYGNDDLLRVFADAGVRLTGYGSGTKTGTPAYNLAVTSTGNIIELPGGVVDGSGTANYVTKWIDANTVGNSQIFDNGTNVGIGTTSPNSKLDVSLSEGTYIRASNASFNVSANNHWGFGLYEGTSLSAAFRIVRDGTGDQVSIGTANNQSFSFWQNNTEKMRIAVGGNVGIGTIAPTSKLEVSGSTITELKVTESGSAVTAMVQATTGYGWVGTKTNHTMYIGSNDGAKITVLTNGNVGIGTTSPGAKLDVVGSIWLSGRVEGRAFPYNSTFGSGADATTTTLDAGSTNTYRSSIVLAGGSATDPNTIKFLTTSAERMRITSTGNVGIGTSSPQGPLEVYKANSGGLGGHIILNNNGLSVDNETAILFNDSGIGSVGSVRAAISSTVEGSPYYGNIKFKTGDGAYTDLYTRMTITGNGNVGIGTTSPTEKLEVQNGTAGAKIKVSNSVGGYASLECSSNATSVAQLSFTNQLSLIGGNVGIGTTSPAYKLDVAGTFQSQGNATFNGSNVYINSDNTVVGNNTTDVVGISGNTMYFPGTGNVGIGTTSPSYKLDVVDQVRITNDATITPSGNLSNGALFISNNGGSSAYSALQVKTTGGLGLAVQNNGNVGIGTASPTAKLQVIGTAGKLYIDDSAAGYNYYDASNVHNFRDFSGVSRFYINTVSGNAGIGTTNPGQKLQVIGNIGVGDGTYNGGVYANSSTSAVDTNWGFDFLYTAGQSDYSTRIKYYPVTGENRKGGIWNSLSNTWVLYGDSNNVPNVIIPTGKVGIGTTNPARILTVSAPSGDTLSRINSVTGAYAGIELTENNSTTSGQYWQINKVPTSHSLQFWNGSERLTILSSGNVGIGTTSPNSKLHVVGPSLTINDENTYGLWISETGDDTKAIILGYDQGIDAGIITAVDKAVTWKNIVLQPNAGNVGIGTTSPSSKLQLGEDASTLGSNVFTMYRGGSTGQYTTIENQGGTVYKSHGVGGHAFYHDPAQEAMRVAATTGNLLVGTSTDAGYRLDVQGGDARFAQNVDAASYSVAGNPGWSGTVNFPTNLPGQQNLQFVNGILVNVF